MRVLQLNTYANHARRKTMTNPQIAGVIFIALGAWILFWCVVDRGARK